MNFTQNIRRVEHRVPRQNCVHPAMNQKSENAKQETRASRTETTIRHRDVSGTCFLGIFVRRRRRNSSRKRRNEEKIARKRPKRKFEGVKCCVLLSGKFRLRTRAHLGSKILPERHFGSRSRISSALRRRVRQCGTQPAAAAASRMSEILQQDIQQLLEYFARNLYSAKKCDVVRI